jgi:hypothetical protein
MVQDKNSLNNKPHIIEIKKREFPARLPYPESKRRFTWTQQAIALSVVAVYIVLLILILVLSLCQLGESFDNWYKVLALVIGSIGGPVGVVIGFYFAKTIGND